MPVGPTINELREQGSQEIEPTVPALPPAPALLDQVELLRRYGSYSGCRKAAKQQGIKFSRTPSWKQLVAAFNYAEACQQLVKSYTKAYPSSALHGITIELKLG